MAGLGHPDYERGRKMSETELGAMSVKDIIFSYIIIKAKFKFPETVKYPSIPCFADESTTLYPLKGRCTLTGAEYVLALKQGCYLEIEEIFYIPFSTSIQTPFKDIIKDVQAKRREYPKGSINNLLYKELGNGIYGSIVRGMSSKKRLDVKSGERRKLGGTVLSNPILAS